MATKDLQKVPHSLFVIAIAVIVLVGAGLLILISNESDRGDDAHPKEVVEEAKPEDGTRRLTGTVTEVFQDCSQRLILVDGEVVSSSDGITCDGGSYIVLDETETIYYASGFVPAEDAYVYDIEDLMPGDTAEVVYQVDEYGSQTLNCETCEVRVL